MDRWAAVAWSVFLHAVVIAALIWGWWQWQQPSRWGERLAIEATVVHWTEPAPAKAQPDEDAVRAAQIASEQRLAEQQAEERRRQAEAEAQAKAQLAAQAAAHAAQRAKAAQAAQAAQQAKEVKAAKVAKVAEAAETAKEAWARAAEAKAAEAKAQAVKRAEAQASAERQRREQELREQLASEERLNALRASGAMDRYRAMIQARIMSNWNRPPSARAGLSCEVRVTQVAGGTVTAVQIGKCNGDASVRDSIENAVYRSQPLPEPPTPELFERNLLFNFHPDE